MTELPIPNAQEPLVLETAISPNDVGKLAAIFAQIMELSAQVEAMLKALEVVDEYLDHLAPLSGQYLREIVREALNATPRDLWQWQLPDRDESEALNAAKEQP